ncbi:hypothetical protein DIC82_17945 [Clostridium beijerinckii]|nr:hypothetical protein DIC82_17945 [Clostridium beijerinckii]
MKKIDMSLISELWCLDGRNGYCNSVQYISNKLIGSYGQNIFEEVQYSLFYTIVEKFQVNIMTLSQIIEGYVFGYSQLKVNIRSSIEAFLDLINITRDDAYFQVIKVGCGIDLTLEERQIYSAFMSKHGLNDAFISFETKNIIAKRNGILNYFHEDLKELYKEYSEAAHSGIFGRTVEKNNEFETKKMITINLRILKYAIIELTKYYSNKLNPQSEFVLENQYIISKFNSEIDQVLNCLAINPVFFEVSQPIYY